MTGNPSHRGPAARVATKIRRVAGMRGHSGGQTIPPTAEHDPRPAWNPGDGVPGDVRRGFTVTMVPHAGAWRALIRPDVIGLEPIVWMPGEGMATARRLIAEALHAPQDSFDISFTILDPDYYAGTHVLRTVEIEIKDENEIDEAHRILLELEQDPAETQADLVRAYDDLNLTVHSLLEVLGRPARQLPLRNSSTQAAARGEQPLARGARQEGPDGPPEHRAGA